MGRGSKTMIFNKASRVTIATLAALLSACALNVRPGVSSLLVKQGKPSVSYDVADPGKGGASKAVAPVRPETAFRAHIDSGLTVEATDKALHAALASLRKADTVENRLRVAAESGLPLVRASESGSAAGSASVSA